MTFAKLLRSVDPEAHQALGFEGKFLRPGSTIAQSDLWPDPQYPEVPLLLESFPGPAYGIRGHRRCDSIYVLWRWDAASRSWGELGRTSSKAWEWAMELRPLALRALRASKRLQEPAGADVIAIAERISGAMDSELRLLDRSDRSRVLSVLYNHLAARMCA